MVEWPLYSPGVNPWDYFLVCLKDIIYKNAPGLLRDFKLAIESEINAFNSDILHGVVTEVKNWLYITVAANDQYFQNIVEKM